MLQADPLVPYIDSLRTPTTNCPDCKKIRPKTLKYKHIRMCQPKGPETEQKENKLDACLTHKN